MEEQIERNRSICDAYREGQTTTQIAARHNLKPRRVWQIVRRGKAWRPRERTNRTSFLGIKISPDTKQGLEEMAKAQGRSVSAVASEALDRLVAESQERRNP